MKVVASAALLLAFASAGAQAPVNAVGPKTPRAKPAVRPWNQVTTFNLPWRYRLPARRAHADHGEGRARLARHAEGREDARGPMRPLCCLAGAGRHARHLSCRRTMRRTTTSTSPTPSPATAARVSPSPARG